MYKTAVGTEHTKGMNTSTKTGRTSFCNETGGINIVAAVIALAFTGAIGLATPIAVAHASAGLIDVVAKNDVSSVAKAENAAFMFAQAFVGDDTLVGDGWLGANPDRAVQVGADGSCFAAATVSQSGHVFWVDNTSERVRDYEAGTSTSACVDLDALVIALGSPTAPATAE